jgi:hypothetical protein
MSFAHRADATAGGSVPWAAVGLVGLILVISVTYGFQYHFPGPRLAGYFTAATVPYAAVLIGLTWQCLKWRTAEVRAFTWPDSLGFVLMSVSFTLTTFFFSASLSSLHWWLVAAGTVLVASLCHLKWGTRGSTLTFLFCALTLYTFLIPRTPHTAGANMLEIVEAASREFLAGKVPYRFYEAIAGDAPFGYLPGLWLPYALLIHFGVDMRVFNMVALMLIILMFERNLPGARRADVLSLTLYPFVISSPLAIMVLHGHVWPYWLCVCAMAFLLVKERFLLAAAVFGLALAARQPAVFLVGPIAAFLYRRVGAKATLKYGAISIVVFLGLILPFAAWTGRQFWSFTYLGLANFDTSQPHLSAENFLKLVDLAHLRPYLQLSIAVLGTIWIGLQARPGPAWLVFASGVIYSLLIFLNAYAVRYVYFPGLLLMSIGLSVILMQGSRGRPESARAMPNRAQACIGANPSST